MEIENIKTVDMINLTINGIPCRAPKGSTILQAARRAGIAIPTLCYLKDANEIGACRLCVVEVKGAKSLVTSCVYPISEGMEIYTNTNKVVAARRTNLKLILSIHNQTCLTCIRSDNCELQRLCREYGVDNNIAFEGEKNHYELDTSAIHMVRDNTKCILCRRCVAVCDNIQRVGAIGVNFRGFKTKVGSAFERNLQDSPCIHCGQCITACPTGALYEKDNTQEVWKALRDPSKHVIVQTAPSVRSALGEMFDMPVGSNVSGKMVAALRRLGFDGVFDTNFAADMTIMEEATEFLERVKNGGKLPLITSCCPGWVKYCERFEPDFIENLSTCKSPQQMFGALAKTYYAEKKGLKPEDIVCVSVMPCTAKKFEITREDQNAAGVPDVDIAITTRELGRMIRVSGLLFEQLKEENFDSELGESTGAGHIFGATGGVMEAALRTASEVLTGQDLRKLEFESVRGQESIKEACYDIGGNKINVCIVSGTRNANKVLNMVRSGEKNYHFIEVMACPGGCVNGGGQPIKPADVRNFSNVPAKRAVTLYDIDSEMKLRKSHENALVKEVYKTYLGEPGSEKAHHLLHTSYQNRKTDVTMPYED